MNPFEKTAPAERNLPIPDQLAEVREKIKELKSLEGDLAAQVREAGMIDGAFYRAFAQRSEVKRLDTKLAREMLGDRASDAEKTTETVTVRLSKIGEEGV